MARKLRIEYPGAIYHVMSRGNRRELIFKDSRDRSVFVDTLAESCAKTGWQVHAHVLMPNHFHLVVETPQANLVVGMKWLLGTYTGRFNRQHKTVGHLFAGRYKSLIVDGSGNGYLKTVCDYVHLNPARAKLLAAKQPLREFVWSSWPAYLMAPSKRPAWLRVDRLMGEHSIPKDSVAGRRQMERRLEMQRTPEDGDAYRLIRRGWCLGGDPFRKELLIQVSACRGAEHYGVERSESETDKAERIVAGELKQRRLTEKQLSELPKGDPEKVEIAIRLRAETVQTVGWIADRLCMGSRNYANHLLWRSRQ